jgi:hypothetical protein
VDILKQVINNKMLFNIFVLKILICIHIVYFSLVQFSLEGSRAVGILANLVLTEILQMSLYKIFVLLLHICVKKNIPFKKSTKHKKFSTILITVSFQFIKVGNNLYFCFNLYNFYL